MRIHSLLIAGALAGLMANAAPARALEANAPAHHVMKPTSHHHKQHMKKNGGSEKHIAIKKDGKTQSAGGTVSKQLIGKSSTPSKHQSVKRSSKHRPMSRNASLRHEAATKSSAVTY
jgi:hypothetical protein